MKNISNIFWLAVFIIFPLIAESAFANSRCSIPSVYQSYKNASEAYFDFSDGWDNKIEGKILDAEDKEIFAVVGVVPVSNPLQKIGENYSRQVGTYSLRNLTPAKYYLVAEIDVPMSGKDKIRYFYPLTGRSEEADVIDIKATDKLVFDWRIPLVKRSIEGKVYWADETPIAGDVKVFLSKSEDYDEESKEKTYGIANLNGASQFSLDGYVGAEYWLQVNVFAEENVGGKSEITKIKAKPIKVKIEKSNAPLKIFIPKPDKFVSTN